MRGSLHWFVAVLGLFGCEGGPGGGDTEGGDGGTVTSVGTDADSTGSSGGDSQTSGSGETGETDTTDIPPSRAIIVFSRDRVISTIEPDGSNLTALNADAPEFSNPTPSPDGARILLTRDVPSSDRKLHIMNADGGERRPFAETGGSQAGAAWSADGSKVAFEVVGENGATLTIANADGDDVTPILEATRFALNPDWSPDGGQLTYAGENGISVVNSDGSDATPLVMSQWDGDPVWSPDGTRIAFSCVDVNDQGGAIGTRGVCAMDTDGANMQRVSPDTGRFSASPRWSPQSDRLVIWMNEDSESDVAGTDLWVVGADGADPIQVTSTLGRGDGDPRWSPDGASILFSAGTTETDLYLVDPDGTNERRVTEDPDSTDNSARWLPVPDGV